MLYYYNVTTRFAMSHRVGEVQQRYELHAGGRH